MAAKKEPLKFDILNAPPELDFYFSLARGGPIEVTFRTRTARAENKMMKVYIDGIIVLASVEDERDEWEIRGRFWGDGVTCWSNYLISRDEKKGEYHEYELWGQFRGGYNKKTRTGHIETWNYNKKKVKY